jgi:hypothetical protein
VKRNKKNNLLSVYSNGRERGRAPVTPFPFPLPVYVVFIFGSCYRKCLQARCATTRIVIARFVIYVGISLQKVFWFRLLVCFSPKFPSKWLSSQQTSDPHCAVTSHRCRYFKLDDGSGLAVTTCHTYHEQPSAIVLGL